MTKELRRRLTKLREDQVARAAENLAENAADPDKALFDRIRAYDAMLAELPVPWYRTRMLAALIGVLCVTLAGALWSLPAPSTRLSFAVEASGARISLLPVDRPNEDRETTSALDWVPYRDIIVSDLNANRIRRLNASPNTGLRTDFEGSVASLSVLDGEFLLTRLRILPRNQAQKEEPIILDLATLGSLNLSATNAKIRVEGLLFGELNVVVEAQDGQRLKEYEAAIRVKELGENLSIYAEASSDEPASLDMIPRTPLEFHNLQISGISFVRREATPEGHGTFLSTIERGELLLPQVEREIKLGRMTRLRLIGLSGTITVLRAGDKLEVAFEGSAKTIEIGPEAYVRDVTPSLLEDIYYNKPLAFFWAAATFLWGVLWSARRLIFDGQ